jgi:alpha-tubulin suppressor-like RCC1 family protein
VGNGHACVLKNGGAVWCWGFTARGPSVSEADPAVFDPAANLGIYLGVDTTCIKAASGAINCSNSVFGNTAFALPIGTDAVDVVINNHWCARKLDGTVICGETPTTSKLVPISNVTDIALTRRSACARKVDGTVWCWGENRRGVLGTSGPDQAAPAQVPGLNAAVKLVAGEQHICALDGTGRIWCWGDNQMNQLGDGLGGDRAQPAVTVLP